MACDTTCLRIMNLYCCLLPDLASFDIEKADLVSNVQGRKLRLLTLRNVHRHGL